MISLFVYGTLKKGFSNHELLLGRYKPIPAITNKAAFTLKHNGFFPAMSNGGEDRVIGELYVDISPEDLRRVDYLEGNGTFYNREKVSLITPNETVTAFAYLMPDNSGFAYEAGYGELFGMKGREFTK